MSNTITSLPNRHYGAAHIGFSFPLGPTGKPLIADATFMCSVEGESIGLYLYTEQRKIRLQRRRHAPIRTAHYTPEIAGKERLPFSFAGVEIWLTRHGVEKAFSAEERKPVQLRQAKPTDVPGSAKLKPKPEKKRADDQNKSAAAHPQKGSTSMKGVISDLGPSVRTGRDGKPYETFQVKLTTGYGVSKEFIGEHLSELTETHGLQKGMKVRLTRLGKREFEVVTNGKTQIRTKNEFAIEILD